MRSLSSMSAVKITPKLSRQFAAMSFVSAVLIVALHSLSAARAGVVVKCIYSLIARGLCQTAVPWFFFAGGFFLAGHIGESNWWWTSIKKRIRTLLVPFWIWSLAICSISVLFAIAVRVIGYDYGGVDGLQWLSLKGLVRVIGLDYYDTMPTMWFLRTLFLFVVMSPVLCRLNLCGLACLFVLTCCFDMIPDKGRVLTQLGHNLFSTRGLFYFSAGLVVRLNQSLFRIIEGQWRKMTVAVVGVLCCLGRIWAELCDYSYLSRFLGEFQIPWLTYLLYLSCARTRIPDKYTGLSFPLYVTHEMIVLVITACFGVLGIGGSSNLTFIKGCSRFAIAVGVSMALCIFMRRRLPRVSRIVFGGR